MREPRSAPTLRNFFLFSGPSERERAEVGEIATVFYLLFDVYGEHEGL